MDLNWEGEKDGKSEEELKRIGRSAKVHYVKVGKQAGGRGEDRDLEKRDLLAGEVTKSEMCSTWDDWAGWRWRFLENQGSALQSPHSALQIHSPFAEIALRCCKTIVCGAGAPTAGAESV